MNDDSKVTTVEERYISAGNSGNLRCETREDAPLGDTAVLIAAGWSPSRIGALLMRLHTKTDRMGVEQAHQQITTQAAYWHMERPEAVAAAVLSWWLSHVCLKCHGRRAERITGTPALSAMQCRHCHGTGAQPMPNGEAGRRLLGFMDDCKSLATDSIKRRLRPVQN